MSQSTMQDIGKLMRKRRAELGMSSQQLGEAVGLTRASISNIENGRQRITVDKLGDIALVLQCDRWDQLLPPLQSQFEQPQGLKEKIGLRWMNEVAGQHDNMLNELATTTMKDWDSAVKSVANANSDLMKGVEAMLVNESFASAIEEIRKFADLFDDFQLPMDNAGIRSEKSPNQSAP